MVFLWITHLKSFSLLCKNFLMFHGRSLCPSIKGVSCNNLAASSNLSAKGAPALTLKAKGPATPAAPANRTRAITKDHWRLLTFNPEIKKISNHLLYQKISQVFVLYE